MVGKIADDDGDDLLLVFVIIDRSQAGEQLIYSANKTFWVLIPVVADGFELTL